MMSTVMPLGDLYVSPQDGNFMNKSNQGNFTEGQYSITDLSPTEPTKYVTMICPEQHDTVQTVKLVTLFFFVGLGLFGNTMSFVILQVQHKKSTINHMLKLLAIVDNCFLISVFAVYVIEEKATGKYLLYGRRYCAWFGRITQHCSVWTIVVIGVIRYVAISRPFYVKSICTTKRSLIAITIIFTLVVIYHIPLVHINKSKPPWSWRYFKEIYFGIVYHMLLVFFIPFTILLLLNICLAKSLKKVNDDACSESMLHNQEVSDINRVIIAIITTFLITNIPWSIVGVLIAHPAFNVSFRTQYPCLYKWFLNIILQTLMYTNSSVNFLIYFFLRKSFRNNLKSLLSKSTPSRRTSASSNSTKAPSARTSFTKSLFSREEL